MGQLRRLYTQVTNTDNLLVNGATVAVLRVGATVTRDASAGTPTVGVQHPGALKQFDVCYVLRGGDVLDGVTATIADAVWTYDSGNDDWTSEITGMGSWTPTAGDRLVLRGVTSGDYVSIYDNDSKAGTPTTGNLTTGTDGTISGFVDATDVDIKITSGTTFEYKVDLPTEGRDYVTPEEFGAAGDGTTDDVGPMQLAIEYSKSKGCRVVGRSGANYYLGSNLAISGTRFDGRGCTITKGHSGVGITVTGGSTYSYLRDFTINGETAPTDYNGSGTAHGILVSGTRTEIDSVVSTNHDGAGFYFDNTTGNMNKTRLRRLNSTGNSLAGYYLTGDWVQSSGSGTDDMSVWDVENIRAQSNWGYGFYTSTTCPLRNSTLWIYSENNGLGASFSASSYGVEINHARFCEFWIYAEQGGGSPSSNELLFGALTRNNLINSTRANVDLDKSITRELITGFVPATGTVTTSAAHDFVAGQQVLFEDVGGTTELNGATFTIQTVPTSTTFTLSGTSGYTAYTSGGQVIGVSENIWTFGGRWYNPTSRHNSPLTISNPSARVNATGEYTQIKFQGSGGLFGFLRGTGDVGGEQKLKLVSHDGAKELGVDEVGATFDGVYILAGSGAPSVTAPNGSLYLRTDAADLDNAIYFRIGGAWRQHNGATP